MEQLFRCPTCFGILVEPDADRCPTCNTRLHKRPPIVLTGGGRTDDLGRRHKRRRFGSKRATAE